MVRPNAEGSLTMVDYEGGKRGGFERDENMEDTFRAGSSEFQESPTSASAGTRTLVPDASGVVNLPAGVSLDDISVQGRDMVITLEDGSRIVIPDGAIIVPQLVIDGVAVPPLNVSALLNDALTPEAQPGQIPSSGGEFDDGQAFLQGPFDLGDLLPYTELLRAVEEEEEIIPFSNTEPDIVIETPDNPVGVENAIATVAERGLPERGEPQEPEGTADETDAETTSGTIVFNAPDGLSEIQLNGVAITSIGQEFVSPVGVLTITSIDLANGTIGFSYTLTDNLLGETIDGFFEATVFDIDGDMATASLSIIVEDDSPIAADDIGIVPGGTFGPIMGNVLDNDESGADDYPEGEEGPDAVTGFSNAGGSADPGDTLAGEYGSLTLNADGSYTYVRDVNTPGGVEESFDYTIIDQDGSTSTATLTIQIEDAPNEITFVPEIGEGTEVSEGGLPPRGDEPVGTGEGADADPDNNSDPSEATGATITFNSPDGLASITINGVEVNLDNQAGDDTDDQVIVDDETGMLVITAVTYDPVTGDGTITYEYTLGDNTSGDDTSVSFEIVVTDLDGDMAADDLVIDIIDDEPDAIDDSATQSSENAPVTVDVFANDIEGADGVELDAIAFVDGTLSGAGMLEYNGDGTFTYTPAPGEEGQVTFQYSITDGDGDSDIATVTIDLLEDSTPEIGVEGDDTVNEAGLDGPPASTFEGSDSGSDSEIAPGTIAITTGGDTVASLVINGVDVTGGGVVNGAYGTLTISFDGTDYSYSYELDNNIDDLAGDEVDSFSLTVTDSDGDTADTTLDITVIDDVATANDDSYNQASENASVAGDVSTNDVGGADGAANFAYNGDLSGTGNLTFNDDGTFLYEPSAGEEGQVTFTYTITDGDGDTDVATVTITLLEDSEPTVSVTDGVVDEAALSDG
ncbi:MAG: tandem-95 repeat protein, partial [Sphingomonadales bacterium]